MKPPYAIESVPSLSGHAVAYRWRSLPRVRRHRASKPQGSSERVLPWQITVGCLRRADSGLVFKYEARPERHPNMVSEECAKSRARTFRSSTEITFRSRLRFFFRSTKNHKFKYIDNRVQLQVTHYRGVENGASRAQQHTGQVRLPGITANTPAPTAVNNNGEWCCPGIRF